MGDRTMMFRLVAMAILSWLMPVLLDAQTRLAIDAPAPDVVVFNISNCHYGSLEFDGAVERLDMGAEWEFRPHLFATFHARTRPNETARVDLTAFRFVATNPRPDRPNGPADLVWEHSDAIDLHLTDDGERRAIPDVSFRVPKAVVVRAALTGMSVRSSGLLWPINVGVNMTTPSFEERRRAVTLTPGVRSIVHVGQRVILDVPRSSAFSVGWTETNHRFLGHAQTAIRDTYSYEAISPGTETWVLTPGGIPDGQCISCVTLHFFVSVEP